MKWPHCHTHFKSSCVHRVITTAVGNSGKDGVGMIFDGETSVSTFEKKSVNNSKEQIW
jgi:hypothetical protein